VRHLLLRKADRKVQKIGAPLSRGCRQGPGAWAKEKPAQTAGQISKVREPSEGNSRNGEPYRLLCNMGSDPCSSSAWLYVTPSGQWKAYRDVKSRPC
jgi:hypothetical protein